MRKSRVIREGANNQSHMIENGREESTPVQDCVFDESDCIYRGCVDNSCRFEATIENCPDFLRQYYTKCDKDIRYMMGNVLYKNGNSKKDIHNTSCGRFCSVCFWIGVVLVAIFSGILLSFGIMFVVDAFSKIKDFHSPALLWFILGLLLAYMGALTVGYLVKKIREKIKEKTRIINKF
jgi:hypothetical protein